MSGTGGTEIDVWLKEGLRLFGEGETARALEQWYRVLDVDPTNARAHDYIALVREHFHVDVAEPPANGGAPAASPFSDVPTSDVGEGAMPPPMPVTPRTSEWGDLIEAPRPPIEERYTAVPSRYASYDDGEVATAPPPARAASVPVAIAPVAIAADPPPSDGATNPWDAVDGPSNAVDLDAAPVGPTLFDLLLAGADAAALAPAGVAPQREAAETEVVVAPEALVPAPVPAPAPESKVTPEEPEDECEALMEGARELFALGDFSGSLELVEKVLELDADNEEAQAYLSRNEGTLLKMYESKLGSLQRAPRLTTSPDEVIWMNLHHRAGFLLSQIDGELTYEDLAAISGMSRLETFRILAELVQSGVIA